MPVSGSGDHHGSSASMGVTWHPETKKPTERRVLRKPLVVVHLGLLVTGSGEPCYQNTSQVCVMAARVSSKFPQNPVTNGLHLGAFAYPRGLDIKRLLPSRVCRSGRTGRLCTRPNRAAAHPSTDTRTGRHEKTGQKAPESHQEPSNREGVVSGGGALSERAEGRQEAGNGIQVR